MLLIFPLIFFIWYLWKGSSPAPLRKLDYYGPKYSSGGQDSQPHRILPFSLIDQYGDSIGLKDVQGKILLSEFFFTTCQSICPIMNHNFEKIYRLYSNQPNVLLLSHSVDPEQDCVAVMRDYASKRGVKDKRWLFLTGDKVQLYQLARKSYLLDAEEGDGGSGDFIHTQKFALVDQTGCIRGYYDGTDSLDVDRLILEMNLLIAESHAKKIPNP